MRITSRHAFTLGLTVALIAGVGSRAWAQGQTPSVTVGGLGYLQYQYQFQTDSTINGHQNNFDVTRGYVNVIGKLGHGIYARVTTDVTRCCGAGQLTIRLKYAYVAWTPENSPLTYKIGMIHTPWLDWEEALWDYRMQGTMAIERGGYLTSSDFGAGIDGMFKYDKFNFQVVAVNGEGYGNAPGDQRKDFEARASFKIMNTDLPGRVGGLRLTAYGHIGKPTTGGDRDRVIGMLSYKSKMLTLAGEYGWTRDSTTGGGPGAITPVAKRDGRVISGYGVLNIPNSKVALLARVDFTDPNTASAATNDQLTRFIGGVSYQLSPNLRLLANVDNVSRQGGNYNNAFNATRTAGAFVAQISF
jgi:hypothetical protein